MNKEEINKLLKDNPIKIIKFDDIEVPVEWLKQSTVNINGDDYIKLQQENQKYKEVIDKAIEYIKLLGKYDGQRCTRGFSMMTADFNKLLDMLKEVE